MVIVYVWLPAVSGERGLSAGHTALTVDDTYISFYPENKSKLFGPGSTTIPRYEEEPNSAHEIILINNLPTEPILNYWHKFIDTQNDFHIVRFNCSTVVYECLHAVDKWEDSWSHRLKYFMKLNDPTLWPHLISSSTFAVSGEITTRTPIEVLELARLYKKFVD